MRIVFCGLRKPIKLLDFLIISSLPASEPDRKFAAKKFTFVKALKI